MSDEQQRNPEAEFREYAVGNLIEEDPTVYEWAGEIEDPRIQSYLAFLEQIVDAEFLERFDDVDSVHELDVFRNARKEFGTKSATRSIMERRQGHLTFFSGLVGYENDVSGMQALLQLQDIIEDTPVFIAYLWGSMGSGKTNFANVLREVFRGVYDNVEEFTNYDTDGAEYVNQYSRIVEDLEERREKMQEGKDLDPYLLVIDEAAQLFTGYGGDQKRSKELAKLLKLARKSRAHVILIGQDGKDIGPALRSLCTLFIHNWSKGEDQYYAEIFSDVVDREGVGNLMKLSKLPETSIWYDTYDEGTFEFDSDEDDLPTEKELQKEIESLKREHEREMMAVLDVRDNDLTQEEIGDIYGVSARTVRNAKQDFEAELEAKGLA